MCYMSLSLFNFNRISGLVKPKQFIAYIVFVLNFMPFSYNLAYIRLVNSKRTSPPWKWYLD